MSLYKGGFTATFQEKKGKCNFFIQSISKQRPLQNMPKEDFQKLWNILQQQKIVEQDMALASLDYLTAAKDGNVVFRFHNISTRNDISLKLKKILVEIIEKYLPSEQQLIRKLRES
ncbi:MAG: hypothetical protein ACFFDP_11905 [Promethearchaeota archaeon]